MPLTHRLLFAMSLLFVAHLAYAATDDCIERAAAIVQQAYPKAKSTAKDSFTVDGAVITLPSSDSIGSDPHALVCKTWPAQPQSLLVAVPLITKTGGDENEGDLELLVLDKATLKVQQRLKLAGRMSDDAIQIHSVELDTARYQLAPGTIAFGLRLTQANNSRANPFEEANLWLYVIDRDQLRPVLDGIVTHRNGGEWDTNCAGTFEGADRTLAMDSATHNGYADIRVTEKSSSDVSVAGKDGQCDSKTDNDKQTYRLSYDGKSYLVPKALRPLG
ncbi:hypothetical protein DYGSA30_22770 [Dyella sp. GSA-30]|nr:hypothetical protein DYGSA30_22770 [Dyella sp. GSA-30]